MFERLLVRDVMSSPVVTISHRATFLDAALHLRRSEIRHLLVVDENRLVGILTDREVQQCVPSRLVPITQEACNSVFEKTTVDRVVTRDPYTIAPRASLHRAITAFLDKRLGGLPVVENGRVIGILTCLDLMEAFQEDLAVRRMGDPAGASR